MKEEAFNELLESVQQAVKISRGEMQPSRVFRIAPVDVKAIREKACKTQESFASMLGVSVGTLRNWEQGRRHPDGAALSLLRVVSADPQYVEHILRPESVTV